MNSKAWDWNIALAPQWEEPAPEVYPLLSRWKKQKFVNLLDLGCGVGRHSILFAKNGFKVHASDLSESGIKKLDKTVESQNLDISTTVSDMLSLPYKAEQFDCVIAFHAIYHADDEGIRKTIAEIHRVLKNGGEAFITFNSQSGTSFTDPSNKHLTENTLLKTKGNEAGIPHYYATKSDVLQMLKGFELVEFSHKEEYYDDYIGAHYFVLVKKP